MVQFKCHFVYDDKPFTTIIPEMFWAKDGFWVDECIEYTNGGDAVVWIAPASIKFVEKVW